MKGVSSMTEAERIYKKKNSIMFSFRLQKSTDADIIEFLEGKTKQAVIKKALREYIANHGKDDNNDIL